MRKLIVATLTALLVSVSNFAIAEKQDSSFNLRQEPNAEAKVVAQLPVGTPIMPIIRQNGWVKVANPKTGDVGWVKSDKIDKSPVVITQIIAGNSNYCKDNNCQFSFYSNTKPITPQQNDLLWQRIRSQEQYILAQQATMQKQMNDFMNDLDALMMQSVTTNGEANSTQDQSNMGNQQTKSQEKKPFWKFWNTQKN